MQVGLSRRRSLMARELARHLQPRPNKESLQAALLLEWKRVIIDPGRGVLIKALVLFSEKKIPETKKRSKIQVPVLGLQGVMDSVRLGCDQDVLQWTQICPNVPVIEAAIPISDHGDGHNHRCSDVQKEERDGYKRVAYHIFERMISEIGKEIELSLRMMERVELPQERHLVVNVMLHPKTEVYQK